MLHREMGPAYVAKAVVPKWMTYKTGKKGIWFVL